MTCSFSFKALCFFEIVLRILWYVILFRSCLLIRVLLSWVYRWLTWHTTSSVLILSHVFHAVYLVVTHSVHHLASLSKHRWCHTREHWIHTFDLVYIPLKFFIRHSSESARLPLQLAIIYVRHVRHTWKHAYFCFILNL